jgi:hypothetical protein
VFTSGVTFGNKTGKLPIPTNVKCCFCFFYKFSVSAKWFSSDLNLSKMDMIRDVHVPPYSVDFSKERCHHFHPRFSLFTFSVSC